MKNRNKNKTTIFDLFVFFFQWGKIKLKLTNSANV